MLSTRLHTRARLTTAVIFGSLALLTTLILLFSWGPPEGEQTLSQLSPSFVWEVVWPPTLAAVLLGAALGGLFERTARLRFGVLYAACLGVFISVPVIYLGTSRFNEVIFALTFLTFDESAATVDTAVAVISGRTENSVGSQLIWLLGPLAGVLVGALLRRSHRQKF